MKIYINPRTIPISFVCLVVLFFFAVVLRVIDERWFMDQFPVILISRNISHGILYFVSCNILTNEEPLLSLWGLVSATLPMYQ